MVLFDLVADLPRFDEVNSISINKVLYLVFEPIMKVFSILCRKI